MANEGKYEVKKVGQDPELELGGVLLPSLEGVTITPSAFDGCINVVLTIKAEDFIFNSETENWKS